MLKTVTTTTTLVACCLLLAGCPKSESPDRSNGPDGGAATSSTLPNDPAVIAEHNRACGLMGRFDYRDARDAFESLVNRYPRWVDARVNLAIATLNRQDDGDETLALKILTEALSQDPDHLRAHFCTGILLSRTADPAAVDHFKQVIDGDPDDPYALYFYASALEEQGQTEEALPWFRKCLEVDPYLRSAYHRLSQILFRTGETDEAQMLAQMFQRLDDNPRARLVKIIYSKMGPKAMVATVGVDEPQPTPRPAGNLFAAPQPLLTIDRPITLTLTPRTAITAADIDDDDDLDIMINHVGDEARNVIAINDNETFTPDFDHPFAAITDVNAVLWGDVDEDGLTDAYLCRAGANQLWRQTSPGVWADVTADTGTANDEYDTVSGAIVDADHDGDLDLFCVNADGPNELLNNNRDGTFSPIAGQQGIDGGDRASRQVIFTDLDADRDADIIVVNAQPPHDVFRNDRLWSYEPATDLDVFRNADVTAVAAADIDADGQVELAAALGNGVVRLFRRTKGAWSSGTEHTAKGADSIAMIDLTGDGRQELIVHDELQWWARPLPGGNIMARLSAGPMTWTPIYLRANGGWSIAWIDTGGAMIAHPGPGRHRFAGLAFTGREDTGDGMRSNRSGIGVHGAARVDSMWTMFDTFDNCSTPGQNLQPTPVGLAGYDLIDFIEIQWPDGVFQSEVHGVSPQLDTPERNLAAGHVERIEEIQRLKSSCPVLFAWNGRQLEFVSDVLGVGGMGFLVAPDEYAPSRPWENFLFPIDALAPRDGRYVITLAEPMEEACYLDSARLVAYDLPPGVSMTLDERMGINGPEPTGAPRFYRSLIHPKHASNDRGHDITADLTRVDYRAAPVGELDHRFLGRLKNHNVVTLEFDRPLDRFDNLMLIADGWIEYPYSQTMFAAWQAAAAYESPTLEARDADGNWHTVYEQFGYPAGMPRQMSVPLPQLPSGCTALRLTTNQEIYWDAIAVAVAQAIDTVTSRTLAQSDADLRLIGFPAMSWSDQKRPWYDRTRIQADWDTRHQRGGYTPFGPVDGLDSAGDSRVAIFGPGEEIALQFTDDLPPLAPGWTRRFVLELHGWCKDMDLFTHHGETVSPLPPNVDESIQSRAEGGR